MYRRRRLAVAAATAVVVTLVLAVGRPDSVPLGEANPWPSMGAAAVPAEPLGVYVVQPGHTELEPLGVYVVQPGDTELEPGQRFVIDGGAGSWATGGAEPGPGQPAVVDRAASGST